MAAIHVLAAGRGRFSSLLQARHQLLMLLSHLPALLLGNLNGGRDTCQQLPALRSHVFHCSLKRCWRLCSRCSACTPYPLTCSLKLPSSLLNVSSRLRCCVAADSAMAPICCWLVWPRLPISCCCCASTAACCPRGAVPWPAHAARRPHLRIELRIQVHHHQPGEHLLQVVMPLIARLGHHSHLVLSGTGELSRSAA